MNLRRILHVFRGEMRCVLRDRATLLMMVVLPIITYPVVAMISSWMLYRSAEHLEQTTVTVAVQNAPAAFLDRLAELPRLNLRTGECELAELQDGRVDLRVEFAATFETGLAADELTTVHVRYDNTEYRSRQAQKRVQEVLTEWRRQLVREGLTRRSLPLTVNKPFWIDTENIAPPRKVGKFLLGQMVPVLLIIFAAIGAFYPAIDVTAMEKERGTLESLLVTPVTAAELMLGKFCSVLSLTLTSVLLNVGSIALTASHGLYFLRKLLEKSGDAPEFALSVTPASFLIILAAMVPVAVIFSSLMMIVAIFARGFKEAQNYMTPLLVLFSAPPMITVFPGFELTPLTACLPLANLSLLFRDMLLGKFALSTFLLTIGTTTLLAIAALRIAIAVFEREEVLFRGSEDLASLLPTAQSCRRPVTIVPLAWLLSTLCILLVYYAGSLLQAWNSHSGLAITELGLILLPALLFQRLLQLDPCREAGFRLPGWRDSGRLVTITVCGAVLASTVAQWVITLAPPPRGMMAALEQMLRATGPGEILLLLLVVALLPAICEEFLFRGTILPAFQRAYSPRTALILTALLFGLIHLDPWRFLPTTLLGFILGLVQQRCRSLLAPVLIHLLNNGGAILLAVCCPVMVTRPPSLAMSTAVSLFALPLLIRALQGLGADREPIPTAGACIVSGPDLS